MKTATQKQNRVTSVQIEQPTINPRLAIKLCNLAALLYRHPETTRAEAAEFVRMLGLAAYVGGHHVAVHVAAANGVSVDPALPQRFALITGQGPDWE